MKILLRVHMSLIALKKEKGLMFMIWTGVEIQRKCWIFRFRIMVKNQRLLEMKMMIALGLTSQE
jgi:hypothetical protein